MTRELSHISRDIGLFETTNGALVLLETGRDLEASTWV